MGNIINEGADQDQFLVQRGEDSYKVNAGDLMAEILDSDYMLIQRR